MADVTVPSGFKMADGFVVFVAMASSLTIGCESVIIFYFHFVNLARSDNTQKYFKIVCFYLSIYFSVVLEKHRRM